MRMRCLLAFFFTFTVCGMATAGGFSCKFHAECYETENCSETDYELDISFNGEVKKQGAFNSKASVSDVIATHKGILSSLGGRTVVMTGAGLVRGIDRDLWIGRDGKARYLIVDTEDLTVIVYHGTCEGAP